MARKDRSQSTHVAIVLDRSGSMESCRDATISGFNEFLTSIRTPADPTDNHGVVLVSVVTFNHEVTPVMWEAPLERLQPIDRSRYVPGGNTAMLDAVGQTIDRLESSPPEASPDRVLVCVISDGLENASRFYSYAAVADRIRRLTATGRWTFTYLGSNQDLSVVSRDLGIAPGNMASYQASPVGTQAAWSGHARATAAYFAAPPSPAAATAFYSEEGIAHIDPGESDHRA